MRTSSETVRYIARRGRPTSITYDNAKTFKGVDKDLKELFKHQGVEDFTANKAIKCHFILEKAPWW